MIETDQFNKILNSFNIKATCVNYKIIDNYFFYDIRLDPAAKVKDINKYADEISLALKASKKPSIKVMHNLGIVRLEFGIPRNSPLKLFDYFSNNEIPKGDLTCLLGQTVDGNKMWMDLSQNPHMIVSGTTGAGKSTLLHNIIANLYNYGNIKLCLMDPKNIEFCAYRDGKMNGMEISYSFDDCVKMIDELTELMDDRYKFIGNGSKIEDFPYVVVIIDEFANLIMQDREGLFFKKLCYLAQKCRAARINIILSTQRPSVDIINGAIKANFPARISCRVASHFDSKVILDAVGAENLLGNGDALVRDNFRYLERFQIAYTNAEEVIKYFGN